MDTDKQQATNIFTTAIILLTIFMAAGIWGITALIRYEHQRDINTWRVTLNIMADSRAAQIQQWVDTQFKNLTELAENSSLQLYTQELSKQASHTASESAELSYLRNLIRASANRYGLIDQTGTSGIPANVSRQSDAGLALIGSDRQIITATMGMPTLNASLKQSLTQVFNKGDAKIHTIFMDAGTPRVAFLQPVSALQMPSSKKGVIAVLVAVKNANRELFPLLNSNTTITKTAESLLVQEQGNLVSYVSPLADGTPPLKRQLALNNELAAAYALNHPGSFKQLSDYSGSEVLATSRTMPGLPWVLVQKINTSEALNESNRHQRFLYIILILSLTLATALLLAAWFYGSNAKEHRITAKLLAKSRQLANQTNLLNTISDNIHDYIFLINMEGRLLFANRLLADDLAITAIDVKNKTLASIFGPAPAHEIQPLLQKAGHDNVKVFRELALEIGNRNCTFHVSCIPVRHEDKEAAAILVSLHDVTDLQEAQEKKNRLLDQIVKALMQAIDQHDPYSTNHSANTARIALAVGRAMKIDKDSQNVLGTAASLCNIGKLTIPEKLLAKTEPLTKSEEKELRREIDFAKEILSDIDFEGPVTDTIIQKNEYLDGSGYPAGLQGDDIIITARILAAANAFVAMISPRAYREKLTVRDALNQILAASDNKYDRQVVAALFHVADNEIDWTTW